MHQYPTICSGQVPEQCESNETHNEGFFLIRMNVIKKDAGRNKFTQFKYRWTVCMAWRMEWQEQGHQYCHQEEVLDFQQLAFQIMFWKISVTSAASLKDPDKSFGASVLAASLWGVMFPALLSSLADESKAFKQIKGEWWKNRIMVRWSMLIGNQW